VTAPRPRDPLPDALRALALVAVLVVNAIGYAIAPWGSQLGARLPADSAWAAATQGLVAALLQGKGYSMLAFVFGMSLWLAARRRPRAEAHRRGVQRQHRLLGLGVLHGVFVYFGDILILYAVVGRLLLGRLHQPWGRLRRHLRFALALAVLAKLAMVAAILAYSGQTVSEPGMSLGSVRGLAEFVALNASTYAVGQVSGLIVGAAVMYLCMACGVAAARLRLLTHRRWRPLLRRTLWRAGPPLALVVAAYGVACAGVDSTEAHPWLKVLGDLTATPMAAVYVVALALLSSGGQARWCHRLGALGQRTLTLYVAHSVVCLVLFSGAGLALSLTTVQTVAFSLSLWLLAWAAAARSGGGRWPLEAWLGRR
jgi:uncharacterized protein